MRIVEVDGKKIEVLEAHLDEDVEKAVLRIYEDLDDIVNDGEKPTRLKYDYEQKHMEDGFDVEFKYAHKYFNYPITFDTEDASFYNKWNAIKEIWEFYTNEQVESLLKDYEKREYKYWYAQYKDKRRAKRRAKARAVREREKYRKRATMYIWQMAFGIKQWVIIGRTWQEWVDFLITLKEQFHLDERNEFVIWCHNLKYDFSFFFRNFIWNKAKTFVTDKIIYYASTKKLYYADEKMPRGFGTCEFGGFRFQDSLCLAGVKEADLPDIMNKYNKDFSKQVGSLDYDKVRFSETPLTDTELEYCVGDVLLLNRFIKEKMEEYGDEYGDNITNIPITRVGEVRRQCSRRLYYRDPEHPRFNDIKKKEYDDYIETMRMDYELYHQIRMGFQGGFTHENKKWVGTIFDGRMHHMNDGFNEVDVKLEIMSCDISSSYPTCIVSKKFPIGPYKFTKILTKQQVYHLLKNYACLFDVTLYNVRPRYDEKTGYDYDCIDNILSYYKVIEYGNYHPNYKPIFPIDDGTGWYKNNGRIRYADRISMTMNEIDWEAFNMFYDYDEVTFHNFRYAEKGYLPKELIKYVLELYKNKCEYKEFDGTNTKEGLLYRIAKVYINCLYGMMATNPLKESFYYTEDNKKVSEQAALNDLQKHVMWEKELEEKTMFLCYQWSHALTSHARLNLFKMIEASGYYNVYCDTDSNKFIKNPYTLAYIDKYNANVDKEMNECFEFYHLPKDSHKIPVKQKDGTTVVKCLGYFEIENGGEPYKRFAASGAKRYLYETYKPDKKGKTLHLTVAGLGPKALDYLEKKHGRDKLFEKFSKGAIRVDKKFTGKLAATYIDESTEGVVIDYLGNEGTFSEVSSVHMENQEYDMKLCEDFDKMFAISEIEVTI